MSGTLTIDKSAVLQAITGHVEEYQRQRERHGKEPLFFFQASAAVLAISLVFIEHADIVQACNDAGSRIGDLWTH